MSAGRRRLQGPRRIQAASALLALIAVACTSADRPTVQGQDVPLPTPLRSFGTSMAATLERVRDAVSATGSRLEDAQRPYRPSEPQALLETPRVVQRAALADPDDGHVLIYDAVDVAAATMLAEELATYLGSGFGQTNYPVDAQFSVTVVADTIVFTWWSPARSADRDRSEAVFDAIAAVGDPVEVLK